MVAQTVQAHFPSASARRVHVCMQPRLCTCMCVCVCVWVCVCVFIGDLAGLSAEACSTVAPHQNSIKQFRSGSKAYVIITSYW
jgi:hypothetical protein